MAKTIKFNLNINGMSVRNIEGLQDNFCIDDVLALYDNKLLHRWLESRSFDEYLQKINAIDPEEPIIYQLIEIFDIELSKNIIDEQTYSLRFWNERKTELEMWTKKDNNIKQIVNDYHIGYDVLLQEIIDKREDIAFLKTATKEVEDKYLKLFQLDYKRLIHKCMDESPLFIYTLLMNTQLREYLLNDEQIKNSLNSVFMLETYNNQDLIIKRIFNVLSAENIKDKSDGEKSLLFSHVVSSILLRKFKGKTDGYWKDLELVTTKVMILSIPSGTFIRAANNPMQELSAEDVNGKFLILDGLIYKSNTDKSNVIYFEV
ncbi:MAG: hypothetical protein E6Q33_04345 [Neisseriales bacterium]|nr:MAG: hypothetical protein E6Q33_04345 [Neisseriales bacterium]